MATKAKVFGYLPNDTPPFGQMLLLGLQHVLTMFPATVLCALLMGFPVNTVLLVTGVGTIVALMGSKLAMGKFIPLYYGSSFSYIAAVTAITKPTFGVPSDPHLLSVVQAGFLATGCLNVLVGLLIRVAGGKKALDVILPATITGPVACTIGIGLGGSALINATGANIFASTSGAVNGMVNVTNGAFMSATGVLPTFILALITLVAAICLSVYLQEKGFLGMLPILFAALLGYIFAALFNAFGWLPFNMAIGKAGDVLGFLRPPTFTFPVFNDPLTLTVLFGVGIMCIATIPESTAHLYQISLYVDHLAEEQGREKYGLSEYIGLNLMLDGLDDIINGIFGSTAGTNYGENNSLMVITRNYSGPVLLTAGCIAILLGFIGPLADIVNGMPGGVYGGLAIYLFGVIGMQGIALMMSEKVNLYDPKQLAIGAVILIVGI
ncbi:MAG TPA: solute carrier family 23 protein, partial [Longilinea sp.]|nr:solute carrier family 23 protein [Longilinea sp.]